MKSLLLMVLCAVTLIHADAQKLSPQKSSLINELNRKIKECNDNIRFFKKGDAKTVIENAIFSATDFGVKYSFDLKQSGFPATTYNYEFRPEDIQFIYNQDLPSESPVGQIKITLVKTLGIKTDNYAKRSNFVTSIFDAVFINFLQVDKKNFASVQESLFNLRKAYQDEKNEPLKSLVRDMKKYKDFWVSAKGESKTFRLTDVVESECTLRFFYSLQSIGTSGDTKGSYLTIINLDDISDGWHDDSKTKPGCIILQSGKKGFETFIKKGNEYKESNAVKELPLFINIESSFEKLDVLEMLNEQIRRCGGKKIKL